MQAVAGILGAAVPAGLLLAGASASLGASFRLMRFPDLTVEGSFLLGASVWAASCLSGINSTIASLAGVLAGAGCGATTAVLSRALGIDRFLAGILVSTACFSLALVTLGASNIGLFDAPDPFFPGFDLGAEPLAGSAAFAVFIALTAVTFFRLRVGIRARIAAVNPGFLDGVAGMSLPYLMAGLALTNALAAASGIAFARFQGFVDVGMGQGVLIVALASFAIGETLVSRLPTGIVAQCLAAAVLGSVIYQITLGAALSLGVPAALTKLVSAVLVLIFLVVQSRRGAFAEHPL